MSYYEIQNLKKEFDKTSVTEELERMDDVDNDVPSSSLNGKVSEMDEKKKRNPKNFE